MNILLLTNHLKDLGGSEVQILELYEYFKKNNYHTKVFANYTGLPIIDFFEKEDIFNNIDEIDLNQFDLVWSQHCVFPLLFKNKVYDNLSLKLISVHLSPYEMLELSSLAYMSQLDVTYVANSPETKDKLLEFNVPEDKIIISYNPAPDAFLQTNHSTSVQKILVVSNHYPNEIVQASDILRKNGLTVDFIGGLNAKRITPEIISAYDVIVTIGKTVQYALLSQKPVYCYDHFGGCGYLTEENFEKAKYYNFSGRGFEKKSAETITHEIINNHRYDINQYIQNDIERLQLSNFVENIIAKSTTTYVNHQVCKKIQLSSPAADKISEFYRLYKDSQTFNTLYHQDLLNQIKILKQHNQGLLFRIAKIERQENTQVVNLASDRLKAIYKSPTYQIIRTFKKLGWLIRGKPKKPYYYPKTESETNKEIYKILWSPEWNFFGWVHTIYALIKKLF